MFAIPLYGTLHEEGSRSQYCSHDYHWMKADQAAFEKVTGSHCLSQAVVISIADHET